MPGVKLFTDVSLNFSKSDYIALALEAWKDEAGFVALNAVAFLYWQFGEVGLSFFLPHVSTQVKAQGWNEEEDCPVTAGEEDLNQVLKLYAMDSLMTKMFDFSKMDDTPLKKDLQNPGGCPKKALAVSPDKNAQKQAFQDALSIADQLEYYDTDGTAQEPLGKANITFSNKTTMGSSLDDDDYSIQSNKQVVETVLDDYKAAKGMVEEASIALNKTSASRRLAGSLATEK
jgi:hypothetical protein